LFLRRLAGLALALPLLSTRAQQASTATPGTIPAFDLGVSPLALRGDARAGAFVSAVGRRAIAMGTEDGRFELWSWPVKWLHDLELSFRIPKYTEPIPGHTIAQNVVERPEGVTIEYTYEQFTVKQHVFVPLDLPAVVMLLEVDAIRPLEILARFTADVHLAWPAGLGGQYLVWNDAARAFLMSEGSRRINAYFGSPAISQASDVVAHMLGAAPPQFVLSVGGAGQQYAAPRLGEPPGRGIDEHVTFIPIVLAGGAMTRDSALVLYKALVRPGAAEREWRRRVAHEDSLRNTRLVLHSPDPMLDRAVEYAKVNLDESFVCNPDLGCGLVAGYGLSGPASDRPGFGWFFGGDAAINSFAMVGDGQGDLARDGVFRFFAKYQRADGKITHEISQGAGWIDWFGKYPYAFYHGDTSPFWVLAFGEYWRQTADTALVRELWPNIKRAMAWSRGTDTNGDGLMENPKAGAGALEVGDLQIGILSDVYLSGVWVSALERFARMADAMGEHASADSSRAMRTTALHTMESRLWMPAFGQYAFALLEDGSVNENLTAWPATAMAFDVFDQDHGARMAARLASSEIMTDWGARPLAATSKLFDPLHYNNGAVWPFVTGWVSLAQYRYHNPLAGKLALDAIARTGFDASRGRNPEVISGRLYKPLDTAVPQQFFATSMVLTPLIRGLLGIDVDAPAHRVAIAPHLPPDWDSVRVENVPVGRDRLDFAIRRSTGRITADVTRHAMTAGASTLDVVFSPALPLGATTALRAEHTAGDVHATVRGVLRDHLVLEVPYSGGWSIAPPVMPAQIGHRSEAPRVLSERLSGGRYVVALEGIAGRTYRFRVREPGTAWRDVDVTFLTTGANADGYTTRTMSFGG
jgi:glycogen debranching enzyme